jgi:hypothetical protein
VLCDYAELADSCTPVVWGSKVDAQVNQPLQSCAQDTINLHICHQVYCVLCTTL